MLLVDNISFAIGFDLTAEEASDWFVAGLLLRKTQDPNNTESMPGAYVYVANQADEAPAHLKSGME